MFIIIGIDRLVYTIYPLYSSSEFWQMMREQFGHAAWAGLRLYDCVFPLFVFMAGVSMYYSQLRRGDAPAMASLLHMWKRALILVLLGMFVNGPISWNLEEMRCASVLGLIGISGAVAGTLTLATRRLHFSELILAGIILVAVALCQEFGGDYTPSGSFNAKADALLCPGVLHSGHFDPEGPLCILSATALCLAGFSIGRLFLLVSKDWQRVIILLAAGTFMLLSGMQLPCIKGIWTPGFVLCTAGIGSMCMAIFHGLIDIPDWKQWDFPLRVVGSNALVAYLVVHIVDFPALAGRLLGGTWALFLSPGWQQVADAATALLLVWLLCLFLYRRKVFIKI